MPEPEPAWRSAEEAKAAGNALLAQRQLRKAREAYSAGLALPCEPALRATLLSNRAACATMLRRWADALADADAAVAARPAWWTAKTLKLHHAPSS